MKEDLQIVIETINFIIEQEVWSFFFIDLYTIELLFITTCVAHCWPLGSLFTSGFSFYLLYVLFSHRCTHMPLSCTSPVTCVWWSVFIIESGYRRLSDLYDLIKKMNIVVFFS